MFINENDKDRLLEVEVVNETPNPENTRNIIGAIADFFEQDSELRDQVLTTFFVGLTLSDIVGSIRSLK
ncbi:MAG: hypothetical protein U0354_07180 [Candidatus Sericytochromatia bacterium]